MPDEKNQWLPYAGFVVVVVGTIFTGIQAWDILDKRGLVWGTLAISADALVLAAVIWSIVYNIRSGRKALNRQAQMDNNSADRIAELITMFAEERRKNGDLTAQIENLTAQKQLQPRTISIALPATKEKLVPRVEITSPNVGANVGVREIVSGTVIPAYSTVQLCVRALDGTYYLQGETRAEGMAWNYPCQFGRSKDDAGHTYEVIAFYGAPLKESRFTKLPVDVKPAHSIQVRRNLNYD